MGCMKKKILSVLVDYLRGIGGTLRVKPLTWGHGSNFGSPGIWVVTSLLKARLNLWLMKSSGSYETYSKFLTQFPSIEEDWALHLLPIFSSRSSVEGFCSRSSSMGPFFLFAGFFSTLTDF